MAIEPIDQLTEGRLIEWRGDPARVLSVEKVAYGLIHVDLRTPDGLAWIEDDPNRTVTTLDQS